MSNELEEEVGKFASLLTEETLALYGNYFSDEPDEKIYPDLYYDCLVFRARDEVRYYYGTVAAHIYDALKIGGYFIFNIDQTVQDIDQIISMFSLFFTYLVKESDGHFYVFRKDR